MQNEAMPFACFIVILVFKIFPVACYGQCDPRCSTDGRCVLKDGLKSCQCVPPMYGDNCQLTDPCLSSPCNGMSSSCIKWEDETFRCYCGDYFFGPTCEEMGSRCIMRGLNNICENSAPCFAVNGTQVCGCLPGTVGDRCQYYTRTHEVDYKTQQTRDYEGIWNGDVCRLVRAGSCVDLDLGQAVDVHEVVVVAFTPMENVSLKTLTGANQSIIHQCDSINITTEDIGHPLKLRCNRPQMTRFLRIVGFVRTVVWQICLPGVRAPRFIAGLMKQQERVRKDVISVTTSPSVIHCATLCLQTQLCMAYTWTSTDHCTMLGETASSDDVTGTHDMFTINML